MLPIIDKPTIQYVVQEAVDSGIEDILIISGRNKRAIEDHFDRNTELEDKLAQNEKDELYNEIRHIADMANIHYVRQKEINGLGDAIYYARFHTGDEPFAVLLGDTIINSIIPVTRQLIDVYEQYQGSIVAVEKVPLDKVSRYGIVGGNFISDQLMEISEFVEKPPVEKAPSDLAIAGRYILTPEIYKALEHTPKGVNDELQLTDALKILSRQERIFAMTLEGTRYDIGNKLDYLKTIIDFALNRDEFAGPLREYMTEILDRKQ
jgi:UTP--glucose-1-phosphate uridylyltransferase